MNSTDNQPNVNSATIPPDDMSGITVQHHNISDMRSEYLLKIAARKARLGGWSVNLVDQRVLWSDEVAILHEKEPGYSPSMAEVFNFYAPEWRERITNLFNVCARDGTSYAQDLEVITAQGNRLWMHISGEAVRDKSGTIVRVQGFLQDVNDRKRVETALYESEQRYRMSFDNNPDGFFAVDTTGRLFVANPACALMSGFSVPELLKMSFVDLIAPDERAKTAGIFMQTLVTGSCSPFETAIIRKDGCRIELWVAGEPVLHDGRVVSVHSTVRDITERKQAQELLQSQAKHLEYLVQERTSKLQAAVGELEHFSYTITHDMRAPLRAMRGYGELLLEQSQGISPRGRGFIERISTAAERMDRLITDALDYSKLVRQEVHLHPVDPQALLRGMIESYPAFREPQAKIFTQGTFPAILGNEATLIQCFSNLLNNAVKFVEAGKVPEVRIWSEERQPEGCIIEDARQVSFVRFWVEDNGIGIPDDCRERIFVMFQRLSVKYEGTGIGLALVKKAAERMGGRVGVESEVGKGSRFWLEFRKA